MEPVSTNESYIQFAQWHSSRLSLKFAICEVFSKTSYVYTYLIQKKNISQQQRLELRGTLRLRLGPVARAGANANSDFAREKLFFCSELNGVACKIESVLGIYKE